MASSKVVPLTCHGHSRPITHLSFSSILDNEQYYLISACKDNNPMLRDGVTGDWIGTFIGHKGAVWQSRISDSGGLAVTGSADFTAKVWDTHTGECLHTLQHNHIVRSVAFAPGNTPSLVATGGFEKKLRIFDLLHGTAESNGSSPTTNLESSSAGTGNVPSWEIGSGVHEGPLKSIVWGPDPNMIITAAEDKKLRWWDVRQNSPISTFMLDGTLGGCELSFSSTGRPTDKSVLSVGAGKTAYYFSAKQPGQLLSSHNLPSEISSVAVNLAEERFVFGSSADTFVHVHNFRDAAELNVYKGHHGPVWSVSFSPDGKLYATGSEDGTIKLWKFCNESYGLWK